jgi:hydrogenase nickel incorporation protein HypA/HybF
MHEWGIACTLVEEAERGARERGALRVVSISTQVGSLSGVVPELLSRAYEMARHGTLLENTPLHIEVERASARCPNCGAVSEFEDFALVCPSCGGIGLTVLSGTRIVLKRLEFEVDDAPSQGAEGSPHV